MSFSSKQSQKTEKKQKKNRKTHVVMALDRRRGSLVADALDDIRVQRALKKEVHLPDTLRLLLKISMKHDSTKHNIGA